MLLPPVRRVPPWSLPQGLSWSGSPLRRRRLAQRAACFRSRKACQGAYTVPGTWLRSSFSLSFCPPLCHLCAQVHHTLFIQSTQMLFRHTLYHQCNALRILLTRQGLYSPPGGPSIDLHPQPPSAAKLPPCGLCRMGAICISMNCNLIHRGLYSPPGSDRCASSITSMILLTVIRVSALHRSSFPAISELIMHDLLAYGVSSRK